VIGGDVGASDETLGQLVGLVVYRIERHHRHLYVDDILLSMAKPGGRAVVHGYRGASE